MSLKVAKPWKKCDGCVGRLTFFEKGNWGIFFIRSDNAALKWGWPPLQNFSVEYTRLSKKEADEILLREGWYLL